MSKKYIPVYDIDHLSLFKQKDILISRFAPYLVTHKNLHLAHKHSFYHLIFFTEGAGTHEIDFHNFPVHPFQIYFMIPGQVHSWNFSGTIDGYVVNFSDHFFQTFLVKADYLEQFQFFNGFVPNSVIDLPEEVHSKVQGYFEDLIRESENGLPFGLDMVRSILLQLFYTIGRLDYVANTNKVGGNNYALLRNFQKLIEKNFTTMRLPKDYAEQLCVTPNHLNSLCRDLVGMQAGEVIRNRIVLEAKRLLINLELSISEIAYKLGFEDNSYFSKFFKNLAKVTPEQFRRNEVRRVENLNNILK